MTSRQGFLAIWCEIGRDDLQDYRAWLTQEHIADRIFLPGFLGVRLFASPHDDCAHFFLYITEGLHVLKGRDYKNVLDHPSPWTQRIMPKFGPFDRAIGEQAIKIGVGFGSHVLVSRLELGAAVEDLTKVRVGLQRFLDVPDVVGVRWMETDRATTSVASQEKTMRSAVEREGDFDVLLVVEALSERGAAGAQAVLESTLRAAAGAIESWDSSVRRVIYGQAPYEGETPAAGRAGG